MTVKRIEVSQTKWSVTMQEYITFGATYVDGRDFVGLLKYDLISYPYSLVSEKPLYTDKSDSDLDEIERQLFWKHQGDIMGSAM